MLRSPERGSPLLYCRANLSGRDVVGETLAEAVQNELLENLERVGIAKTLSVSNRVESRFNLKLALHLMRPFKKRGSVSLTILPTLQKNLGVSVRHHLPI